MAFAINTNVASLQAQNSLRVTGDLQSKTINRVTSGLRIVASGDDAAGLAIANTYRSDGAVLAQGVRNANDGLSQLQTADGGINNISQLLDRARTLATQSASGAFTGDRSVLNSEFQSVIQEIDRQAQAIGLNTGGQFAKALSVFIGGGQASNGISATTNGSVSLDLSRSTVDAASLGLKGVQAIGVSGTDIGSGSASTSLSTILSNATNTDSVSTPGFTTFVVKGPGFDGEGVKLSVNTANLGGTSDLTAAVNAAIQAAGNGGTQEATALKNANIIAGVNTDSNGRQQLTFTSPNAAFQVVAGDRLANALLGKFEQNATLTGADTAATIATNGGGTADDLTIAVDGGSAFTVTLGTTSATHSKGDIVKQLNADADFSEVATAYLEGNQVVLKSKTNSSSSSIEITSTTLATNLGLSTTEATAADASTGADLRTRVTAATETAAGSSTFGDAGAGTITFRIQGAGLAAPVDVAIAVTASTTVNQAISALDTAVGNNSSLKAAGVTLSTSTAGNTLTFTSTSGQAFSAQVTGDVQNKLGFGSFTTGANGAVDYSTITGSSNYDRTTAVGTNTFEISLNGGASSTNSIAVDLTGGDATKASLTGSDTNTSVQILSSNRRLNLEVNGVAFTVDLDRAEAGATKSDIADQINTVIAAQGRAYAEGNAIVIESDTAGAGGTVKILDGTANTALGFTTGQSDSGDSRSGASIAQFLNQAFAADAELQAAGLVADFGSTQANRITIKSTSGVDTFFRVNSRGSAAAASVHSTVKESVLATAGTRALSNTTNSYTITAGSNAAVTIAVDGGGNQAITLNAGTNRTANDIVAELNGKITGATAYVDQTGAIQIASNTTGTGSSVQFVAVANSAYATLGGATTGTSTGSAAGAPYDVTLNTNDKVYVSVNGGATQTFTLTAGTNRTAAQIVADFSDAEGFSVVDDGGTLKFVSSDTGAGATLEFKTGSNDAYTTLGLTASTVYSGNQAETGWGVAGATFTGNVNSSAPAIAGDIEAGGSSQSSAFAFSAIAYGTDDQTITVNASDTNGVQQSATITLRNDATARSGRSIDEAIATINTSLQQSNNATLQKIVAVKDNSDGSEKIRFLSAVNNFKVSIGSTANGTGVGSQGTTDTAELADGGSTASIVDVTSAQAAVSALADAVSLLGKAQAVVGRGQNQFAFAINLAQSQITNLAAAESRIRDADLAAESANLTKSQILLQAGIAALAQANSAPQQVLSLLRG